MQSPRSATPAANAVRLGVLPSGAADLLDYLAPPSPDLTLAALQPCRITLAVFEAELALAITMPGGSARHRRSYRLPIEKAWHAPLLRAFAPRLGHDGNLLIRPCRLMLEWSSAGLGLELVPEPDTWVSLPLPPGVSYGWLGIPLAPVAAAALIAALPVLPALAADYVVKPGDTLYAISGRVMGEPAQWPRLFAANRDKVSHPRLLMPGTRLRIPGGRTPAAMGSRTVVVRAGDTLYGLSRRHLGSGERWRELWQQVKGRVSAPERLPVGLVLRLPSARSHAVPTARTVMPRPAATPTPAPVVVPTSPGPDGVPQSAVTPAPAATPLPVPTLTPEPVIAPSPLATLAPEPAVSPSPRPTLAPEPVAMPSPMPVVTPEPVAIPSPVPTLVPEPVATPSPHDADSVSTPADDADSSLVELPAPEPTTPPAADAPSSDHPALPQIVPARANGGTIERPFASHVAVSYLPRNHTEALTTQSLFGQATVLTSFGADGAWRAHDNLELAASYLYNHYPVDRGVFGRGNRHEQHSRLMGYYVWPALPNLELAIGLGGLISDFGQAAMPVSGRAEDYFDRSYQRLLADVEAKAGYRPVPDLPLTLTAGISALPIGAPAFGAPGLPDRFWGLGWHAGARYTLGGWAVETGYRGQRIFGESYQQSSDLLHGTVGYYFK